MGMRMKALHHLNKIFGAIKNFDRGSWDCLTQYDELTQLPNRFLFLSNLKKVIASSDDSGPVFAVLIIDVDHFKHINAMQGYRSGDELLQKISHRLSLYLKNSEDILARIGGDVFALLLKVGDKGRGESVVRQIGECLLQDLQLPFDISNPRHKCSVCIGATVFDLLNIEGDDELKLDEVIRRADLALYDAKSSGRNSFKFFKPSFRNFLESKSQIEDELRVAIERNQFELHYQLQVSSCGGVIGAEALLRWMHPRQGLLNPGSFIHIAEQSDLICKIGFWVLNAACSKLYEWGRDPLLSRLSLAINISSKQFQQMDFVRQVLEVLGKTGVTPELLEIELTESLLLDNVYDVIEKMQLLKQYGVGLALDDFGTGYSSLSYLKNLPFDRLKIDGSFVRDVARSSHDAAIVKTIIELSNTLGLSVIAEGVETIAQQQKLHELGCCKYQGYLFGYPLPEREFIVLVRDRLKFCQIEARGG